MARSLRFWYPGAIVHAVARGNEGQEIFRDDDDRRRLLNRLEDLKKIHGFLVYAYALMSNHFHFLIATRTTTISRTMHQLLTSYTTYFNSRHERDGHLLQDRFHSRVVENEPYLLRTVRYIHRNPPKAGMVRECSDYPWSSHLDYLGLRRSSLVDCDPVLAMFGSDRSAAREAFCAYVGEAPSSGELAAPLDGFFAEKEASETAGEIVIIPPAPTLVEFFAARERAMGVSLQDIRSGSRKQLVSRGRQDFIRLAVQDGYRPVDIARFLSCSEQAVAMILARSARS